MNVDLRNVPVKFINVDTAIEKNKMMHELCQELGMTDVTRVSAITGVDPHIGVRRGEEHYRNCAESHFKILQEAIDNDSFPILILEDDVDVPNEIKSNTDVLNLQNLPDDVDAVYVGTSHSDGQYNAFIEDNNWLQIEKIFATHAILYLNKNFAQKVIERGKIYIYEMDKPFDLAIAYELQPNHKVFAVRVPLFFQSDEKNEVNKWEHLTRQPLNPKKRFSVFTL
jgi:GR25 family glycosyltransferase involved in LPS biosynthesis